MDITFDKYSLIIDGKRTVIKSGAFHYFRSPGEKIARDRFFKMKAGGYNAVDIYFNWNYHSKAPGEYDFSGLKDVRKVLKAHGIKSRGISHMIDQFDLAGNYI